MADSEAFKGGRYEDRRHQDEGDSTIMDDIPQNAKEEIREWITINRKLRKHGLESVRVYPSQEVSLNTGRYICIDLESSQSLRTSVASLITEIDRKENMVQDVYQSCNQLRTEASQYKEEAEHACAKAKDIKVMLECSRARVQELEEDISRTSSHYADDSERLRNTKSAISVKTRQLEAKTIEQEKEIDRLRRELLLLGQEEERRTKRQNQVFVDFKKRTSRAHSAMDQKLLDIIDSYECQIDSLQQQLDASRHGDENGSHLDDVPFRPQTQPGNNFKGILRSYEKQLREQDRKIKALEDEKEIGRSDLGSRTELKDYRLLAQRVKKLEKLLALHHISIPGEKSVKDPFASRKKYSTRLEDLEYLPLEQCHHLLREVCAELELDNLDCLTGVIEELKEDSRSTDRFQEYCREMADIVERLDESSYRNRHFHQERDSAVSLCDANMRHYLEVLDNWRKDVSALGDLQVALNSLFAQAVPWMRAHMDYDHSVMEMVELVERVTHADKSEGKQTLMEDISRANLEAIVAHFQTLFDVPKVSGIYPRMNEIYSVLGKAKNVQNTLKNLVGLAPDANSSALVDSVGRLCHSHNSTTAKQLKKLMQTDDLNGVIRRLDEHTEFFPAFQAIMHKLFDILGVDKMDEVLPAVRALKLLSK